MKRKMKVISFFHAVKFESESKARSHSIQYMQNKPVKWGYKTQFIADHSDYPRF